MGLISTEVEVGLATNNISYYHNLGYNIPKTQKPWGMTTPKGTKIIVNTNDLPKNSLATVKLQCDNCGEIYESQYRNYALHNHNGKCYCCKCAVSVLISGKNHYRWNSSLSENERSNKRNSQEYKDFIKSVMARDNYTCVITGKTGEETELEVHHLDGYDWCIEGRTNVANAITIAKDLHKSFHAKYGRGGNTRKQFEEWIGYTLPLLDNFYGDLPTAKRVYDVEENKIYTSAIEYAKIHKVAETIVYACCNHKPHKSKHINKNGKISYYNTKTSRVAGHHLLWYDEYLRMSQKDLEEYLQKSINKTLVKVICITTGKIFNSIAEASRYYKVYNTCICDCCKGKMKSTGKLVDGTPLQWMYYNDFQNLSQEEQNMILNKTI